MMRIPDIRFALAALLIAGPVAAFADNDAASWMAAQHAQAAQQLLSERYTAIWSTLSASEKPRFAASERAWLNGGRQQEEHACVAHAGQATALVLRSCEVAVTERRLAALAAPASAASVAAARR